MSRDKEFVAQWLPYRQRALNYCRRLLGDLDEAEDAMQEVYMKLWHKRDELREVIHRPSYLLRMCHNYCMDRLRSAGAAGFCSYDDGIEVAAEPMVESSEERAIEQEQIRLLERWTERLGEPQRSIWIGIQLEHRPSREIAQELQLTEVNVRVILSRLRKALRAELLRER